MSLAAPSSRPDGGRARRASIVGAAVFALSFVTSGATAQTISGTLIDLNTEQPIPLGLVMMFTEEGDSVGLTVTDEEGRFSISSPEPGSFVLLASALGYSETRAGVFELGDDGVMTVEYRLPPHPLALEQLVVSLNRPINDHHLVRNGFVRRFQRGLGVFVTPHDIEESLATSTEQLLSGLPGINVQPVRIVGDSSVIPRPDIGEAVMIRSTTGGWCMPTVYVDGARVPYDAGVGVTLSSMASLAAVDAIEVYRRASEIPVEYAGVASGCGVMVVWTKLGLALGQELAVRASGSGAVASSGALPPVSAQGEPPVSGERIRLQLAADVAESRGLPSPWEATFRGVLDDQFIADPGTGRPVALPLNAVDALQVERPRAPEHALLRGALAGIGVGGLAWVSLRILCRSGCDGGFDSPWFPATLTGLFAGGLVGMQGPGTHWVRAPLPQGDESGARDPALPRRSARR